MDEWNWGAIGDEAVGHLQALLRFDTTNPPGDETACVEYIAGTLSAEGYQPVVLESAPGRGNVVARFKGTGQAPPLLIYGHVDVVTAEPDKWRHAPFRGDLADGCIWGRGALDMKGMVAQELMAMLLLAREGQPLSRDVIFAATADEEVGGEMGAGWLVENHPDLIRAEYGLSEGAGATLHVGGRRFYPVRTAEKGTSRFKIRAFGPPGHGSVPRSDTAVHAIAEAVDRLCETRLPLHLIPTAIEFLRIIGQTVGVDVDGTPDERTIHDIASRLPADRARAVYAVTRNTATPTGLRAGSKINVIPGEAEASVDGRILPGQSQEAFFDEVKAVVGDGYEIRALDSGRPMEEPPGGDLYETIAKVLAQHDPDALLLPSILSGATDARWISRLGTRCLGFSPLKLEPDFSSDGLVHGHDERVPADGFVWGTRVFYDIVRSFAGGA